MTMHVDATPEEVYDLLADVDNERSWNPDVKSVRRIDEGPVGAGAEWDGDYKGMGTMRVRLVECERPHRLVFSTTGPRMRMRFAFHFAPGAAAATADVTADADIEPAGITRLFAPLLGPMMRRTMAQRPAQIEQGVRDARQRRAGSTG
jgi:carbon monoxide dehydrogenase subunit G